METTKVGVILFVMFLTLFLIAFGPFFTIWSLNTIFGLEIVYSFKTWAAMIWMITIIHGIKLKATTSNT